MNNLLFLGDNIIVRLKQSGVSLALIAGVILAHQDLLTLSWRNIIVLLCLIVLANTNASVSKFNDRSK